MRKTDLYIPKGKDCFDKNKRPCFKYQDKYEHIEIIYERLQNNQEEFLMDGVAFEYFCADLLLIEGFKDIQLTKASGDNGVDIIAHKNDKMYIFQCKCLSHTCSNKAIQEIVSANTIYKANCLAVICNTDFSDQARMIASVNQVQLYNRGAIKHILDKYFCDFYDF